MQPIFGNMEKYPRGRRGSPAKGVVRENRSQGSNPCFSAKIKGTLYACFFALYVVGKYAGKQQILIGIRLVGNNKFSSCGYPAVGSYPDRCFSRTDSGNQTVIVYHKNGSVCGSIGYTIGAEPWENKWLQPEGFHETKGTLPYI